MNTAHQIDEVIIDLTFTTKRAARKFHAELQRWIAEELMTELDRLLSDLVYSDQPLRLEQVTLQLGDISGGNYKEAFVTALEQHLAVEIGPQLYIVGASREPESEKKQSFARLEQLLVFLREGKLPWQAQTNDHNIHQALLNDALKHYDLGAIITEQPDASIIIKRLSHQFSNGQLSELALGLVKPQQKSALMAWLDLIVGQAVVEQCLSVNNSLALHWELLLELLLLKGNQFSSLNTWLIPLVSELAQHKQQSLAQLLIPLHSLLNTLLRSDPIQAQLATQLLQHSSARDKSSTISDSLAIESTSVESLAKHARLPISASEISEGELRQIIPAKMQDASELLALTAQRQSVVDVSSLSSEESGSFASLRHDGASVNSEPMRKLADENDLKSDNHLKADNPDQIGESDWGINLIAIRVRLEEVLSGPQFSAEYRENLLCAIVQKITLTQAPERYLENVIAQIEAQQAIDLDVALQKSEISPLSAAQHSMAQSEMLLLDGRENISPPAQDFSASEGECGDEIQLPPSGHRELAKVTQLPIAELASLCRDLRRAPDTFLSVTATLDYNYQQYQHLLDYLLRTDLQIAAEYRADFYQAITLQARSSGDPIHLLRAAILRLLRGELLDLEQLAQETTIKKAPAAAASDTPDVVSRDSASREDQLTTLLARENISTENTGAEKVSDEYLESINAQDLSYASNKRDHYAETIALDSKEIELPIASEPYLDAVIGDKRETTEDAAEDKIELHNAQIVSNAEISSIELLSVEDLGGEIFPSPIRLDDHNKMALTLLSLKLIQGAVSIDELRGKIGAWQHLFVAYVQQNLNLHPIEQKDLVQAVRRAASLSRFGVQFYRSTLSCLIAQQPLDLEQLRHSANKEDATNLSEKTYVPAENIIESNGVLGATSNSSKYNSSDKVSTYETNDPLKTADIYEAIVLQKYGESDINAEQQRISKNSQKNIDKPQNSSAEEKRINTELAFSGANKPAMKSLLIEPGPDQVDASSSKSSIQSKEHNILESQVNNTLKIPGVVTGELGDFVNHSVNDLVNNLVDGAVNSSVPYSNKSFHDDQTLFLQLMSLPSLTNNQLLQLQKIVNSLISQNTHAQDANTWGQILMQPGVCATLVNALPEHILHSLVARLAATDYPFINGALKLVQEAIALVSLSSTMSIDRDTKNAKWEFIFSYLFNQQRFVNQEELLRVFSLKVAKAAKIEEPQTLAQLQKLVLQRSALVATRTPARAQFSIDVGQEQKSPVLSGSQMSGGLHLKNAGMVLVAPYIPRLFSMLQLTENGQFINMEAAERGVHLLQYLVSGKTHTEEYELVLNKILCGISTSIPVCAGIELSLQEQETMQQMLLSIIQHWRALGKTSITGLRETFLQRQGWLRLEEDAWQLEVKEQTFDMLVDSIPWSYSLVKFSWMDKPLYVSWRNKS